jgi:hypothetical protein
MIDCPSLGGDRLLVLVHQGVVYPIVGTWSAGEEPLAFDILGYNSSGLDMLPLGPLSFGLHP